MNYIIRSRNFTITVSTHGAEVVSIIDNNFGNEYIYTANPRFWNRRTPVLFPIVGAMKDGSYTYEGETYQIPQHGFARDLEFDCVDQTFNSLTFRLSSSQLTKKYYPFDFDLYITYRLDITRLDIEWKVVNTSEDKPMFFSIGGHPGFACPFAKEGAREEYKIRFDGVSELSYYNIGEDGLATPNELHTLSLEGGLLPVTEDMFNNGAMVFSHPDLKSISLLRPNGRPYVTVGFDSPLVGLWATAKENTPFICIEPWFGRCDTADASSDIDKKEYIHRLENGETFSAGYNIELIADKDTRVGGLHIPKIKR